MIQHRLSSGRQLACLVTLLAIPTLSAQDGQGGFCDQLHFVPISCSASVMPAARLFLTADGTDCTLRSVGTARLYAWSKVSGPAGAVIEAPDGRETRVTFQSPGAYTFELTAFNCDCCIPEQATCRAQLTVVRDCNRNATDDAADIRSGTSPDANGNAIPDECEGGIQISGDCNQDGTLDISDPICLLGFLFTGASARLPCGDGGPTDAGNVHILDTSADQAIDISDAIRLLGFLFNGSAPPAWIEPCGRVAGCPEGPGSCSD